MYDKPTANIIINYGKLVAFHLKSETRKGCPLSPFLLNIKERDNPNCHLLRGLTEETVKGAKGGKNQQGSHVSPRPAASGEVFRGRMCVAGLPLT